MAPRMTRIYVVKYIGDTRRFEPRNVGILVAGEEGIACQFLGEKPTRETIDRRGVRHLVHDTDIYVDWVAYWRRTAEKGPDAIDEILETPSPQYWVVPAGEVWLGDDDVQALTDRYFVELVRESSDDDAPGLKPVVDRVLTDAGVADSDHLAYDQPLPTVNLPGPRKQFQFHYVYVNGATLVARRVSLTKPLYVNDALWRFDHVPDDVKKVAFISGADEDRPVYKRQLEAEAVVIDIDEEAHAVDLVRETFNAEAI